jgi:predicted HAD superfamily Cof-like phosphohydrolase
MGQPVADRPTVLSDDRRRLRINLIQEEAQEVVHAMVGEDLADIAKELCDLLYVTYGAAVECGLDLERFWWEVHGSNMRKDPNLKDAQGKTIKPPNWQPARVREILEAIEAE